MCQLRFVYAIRLVAVGYVKRLVSNDPHLLAGWQEDLYSVPIRLRQSLVAGGPQTWFSYGCKRSS
jgi:hypothetical protein